MKRVIILNKKIKNKLLNKYKYYYYKYIVYKKNKTSVNKKLFHGFISELDLPFEIYESLYGVEDSYILEEAEKIIKREFNILGKYIKFERNIEWNLDFNSNFRWNNEFYKDIKTVDLNNNSDVKIPWELSRFQHLYILVKAYEISHDIRYVNEIKFQIEDWINKNTCGNTVNWTCAMDVSIRAVNWIICILKLQKVAKLNIEFIEKINISLYEHLEFIYRNIEKNVVNSNNHYFSNIIGMIWLCKYFESIDNKKSLDRIKVIDNFSRHELILEMNNQIFKDGVNYEISIPYHCLVTEMLVFTEIMLKYNNDDYLEKIQIKTKKMLKFVAEVIKPNNNIPLIGDMDSGRFIQFTGYGVKDKRNFNHLVRYYTENNYYDKFYNKIILKESSGYAIYKNNKYQIVTRCGKNAMNGQGNHNHNDNLSFELSIGDKDFIIDPGTFCYTSNYNLRNIFRSTSYHNTVQVEGFEQNRFKNTDIFKMKDESDAKIISINRNSIEGKVKSYCCEESYIHQRKFTFSEDSIKIEDQVIGKKDARKNSRLFLGADVKIKKINKNELILLIEDIKVKLISQNEIIICNSVIAPEYGVLQESNMLNIIFNNDKNSFEFIVLS